MKFVLLFCACATVAFADKYTTKYDNVDLDAILRNQRLYNRYFECLIGRKRCPPDGKELKNNIPDALATDCIKCSEKQKDGLDKILKFIIKEKPGDFALVEKKYDPSGVYRKKYNLDQLKSATAT